MVKRLFHILLFLLLPVLLSACEKKSAQSTLRVGHNGGYLSAALYAAQNDLKNVDIQNFHSTSDIAYALIMDRLDAGFVEAEKLAAFAALDGFNQLTVVGKVTYPYGATLILRKGLNVRLQELGELRVAASEPGCVLLEKFAEDAKRLGADISKVKYEYMVFHAMLPALESGAVDAAIVKGSYSVAALQAGHHILYQNWDVEPGDECCPAIISQAALVLVARRDKLNLVKPFVNTLVFAQKSSPDRLRHAVAESTVIPYEILQGQPVPEFSPADDELLKALLEAAEEHHEDKHGEHEHK
jgi:ABC-type nitrate/sulfonate/bicarbonate transport system substrate-binding protein